MDRLDELALLTAIVDAGSLAGAARRLRRSPPAVTRALADLEARVGVRLIERTTRRLAPTEAGRTLAARGRAILEEYEAAILGVSAAPVRGLLRVTAPVQFGRRHIAPIVSGFLDAYPEVQVELMLHDRNLDLIEEGLDVAVRIGPLADSTLRVRRVGEVRRVVVASRDYLARRGVPAHPQELTGHDILFSSTWSGPLEWRFGTPERPVTVRLAPRLLVNEVEAQLIAVRAGRGIGRFLSYQVAEDEESGWLVRLLAPFEPPPLPIHLVTRSASHMPQRTRAFVNYAADALRRLPVIHAPAAGQTSS